MPIIKKSKRIPRPINSVMPINDSLDVKNIGDQVWLKSGVMETDPSVYPEANLSDIWELTSSVSTSPSEPTGMTWDGTHFWCCFYGEGKVRQYHPDTGYTGVIFDVVSGAYGIAWDGQYFWVVDRNNRNVYRYNSSGSYTGFNFDVTPLITTSGKCKDLCFDGSHLWVSDAQSGGGVYKYTTSGNYTGISTPVTVVNFIGIAWDGQYFWVAGGTNKTVYQHDSDMKPTGVTFELDSSAGYITGMTYVNGNFHTCSTWTERIAKYENFVGVGISTKKTDSETNLPYYVRVK